jgi:hypothetical protein
MQYSFGRTEEGSRHALTTPRGPRGALWREVILGADESSPPRPGRHLETRQRLGIVPTWSFWNRCDVWRSARWYACPMAFIGVQAGFWAPMWFDLAMWPRLLASQAIGVGTLVLGLGALERYIRKQLPWRHRRKIGADIGAAAVARDPVASRALR